MCGAHVPLIKALAWYGDCSVSSVKKLSISVGAFLEKAPSTGTKGTALRPTEV
jgi:hypothetical protein